jgi:hypothetical protein
VLNHLHSSANTQNRDVSPLGQIKNRSLCFVTIWRIAAISRKIISARKDDAVNILADRQCGIHRIGYRDGSQPAPEEKFYPDLIEAISTHAMLGVDSDPLGDGNGLHDMT